MALFDVYPFKNNNPSYLHSVRDEIDMDPVYQRQSEVWPVSKRQLLIDSILNDFDLPKIYLHELSTPEKRGSNYLYYALVDGKQRLGAIFDFIDGKFALNSDFEFMRDSSVRAANLTFSELGTRYPRLIARFLSTSLPIVVIKTDELELIEEMFSRLNEAVPLNAPEKRNAFKGPAPSAVRALVRRPFFLQKLPFSNNRYRHYDLAAKFLLWEDEWVSGPEFIRDVKKTQLDAFFRNVHRAKDGESRIHAAMTNSEARLTELESNFVDADPLLASVGMVSVYYILCQDRNLEGKAFPQRERLLDFERARKELLPSEEGRVTRGHLAVFEFNRLAQSPNDAGALAYRFRLLNAYVSALENGTDPLTAIAPLAPDQIEKNE